MKDRLYAIFFMMICSIVTVTALSAAGIYTREIRQTNKDLARHRALLVTVDPDSAALSPEDVERTYKNNVQKFRHDGFEIFHINFRGQTFLAIPVSGQGFWGNIYGFMAFKSDNKTVLGLAFYSHQETPGLGQRIEEPWFIEQFLGRDTSRLVKGKIFIFSNTPPEEGYQPLKAITGATRTSISVEDFLNKNVKDFQKAIAKDPLGKKED